MKQADRSMEYKQRFEKGAQIGKWAVTMTKVCIRQAVAESPWPRWHFVSFWGPNGRESRGVVDMIAIRKNHRVPPEGAKRGDILQIILVQVKGGSAAKPTKDDANRLRIVARQHGACAVLFAAWRKGKAAQFFLLSDDPVSTNLEWVEVLNLQTIFC